ncbi:MAG: flagellar basal body L-ring protein FlgH [Desulfomonilia bacterium]|jgi:flagellar L-ring protein precursor FlgH
MKLWYNLILFVMVAALSACSHAPKDFDRTEDELSIPMGDQTDYTQSPGSLWAPTVKYSDMYSDHKARQVGDLVIIQISESSSADKQAKTDTSKDSSIASTVTDFLGFHVHPQVQTSSASTFTGDGETSRSGTLNAVVSARIIRVLPEGNFVIRGKKQIRVNDESQYIMVSGIIRPDDIQGDNSVLSANVADLKVEYYGKGILGDQQDKGFLAKAFDKLWPF